MTDSRASTDESLGGLFTADPLAPYLDWVLGAQALFALLAALSYLAFVVLIVFWTRLPGRLMFAAGNLIVLGLSLYQGWQYRQMHIVGLSENMLVRGATSLGAALASIGLLTIAISLVRQRRAAAVQSHA
jgi:hypothetical protein